MSLTPIAVPSPVPSPSPTPTSTTATPTTPPPLTTVVSDDGMLALELAPGSLPLGVTVTASARGQADLPPELAGLEVRSAFYALEPAGLTFDQPAMASRTLSMSALGFDPAESGVPVVLQADREADGTWAWLTAQEFDWDGGDAVRMSGQLTRLSDLFGFGGTAFIEVAAVGPGGTVPVDQAFTLTVTLRYDADLDPERRPAFSGSIQPYASVDGAITFGDMDLTPAGETGAATLELPVICQRAGEVAIGVAFGVTRMGASEALLGELGLPETTIAVSAGTSVTCVAP